jgi:hypothetical protein
VPFPRDKHDEGREDDGHRCEDDRHAFIVPAASALVIRKHPDQTF